MKYDGPYTGRSVALAPRGMVATSHYLASASGLAMLRRGGSAVDAAIAANAVLCVAYPHMAGLGGDAFALVWDTKTDRVRALNASGPSAALATREYYRKLGHTDEIPARGPLSALTVPGVVDGWRELHERYGRLEWKALFEDAIRYASDGVPIGRSLSQWLTADYSILSDMPLGEVFLSDGLPREGERLVMRELGASFEEIAAQGARTFYEGKIAERICSALSKEDSPLRRDDFASFKAEWVEPIKTTYRGYEVYEFPPNTQGFAALQILNLIEGYDPVSWGDNTADFYHYMAEAVKVSFADRDEWLTDPKFVTIPLEELLSKSYADERRELIHPGRALTMSEVQPGIRFGGSSDRNSPGGDTCAFSAIDENGLAVSMIQSIYYDFGSAVTGGDTGIIMQNRGSFFSLNEADANTLEPGKRSFHTLTPGMVLKDGKPHIAFGTMGGEGQPQTHAAMLVRLIDYGYDVQQAIEAPRWLMGKTWGVTSKDLSLEGRIPDGVVHELAHRGQPVKTLRDWDDNMGHAQAIRIDATGFLEGGADPRGDGAALGY